METINPELRREVALQIPYCGDNELALGYSRAQIKTANSVAAEIQKFRTKYEAGKVSSIGSATFSSADNWKAIAAESDREARSILLGNSSLLTEVSELQAKAAEAQRTAEQANRELEALWNEYQSLPDKAAAINRLLENLRLDRESLDVERLNADFRDFYRAILEGALVNRMALVFQAGAIATRDLRLEVIGQLETKLQAELAELKARSKVVAKKLGQKSNIIIL
jgi:hypothetical protein